METWAQQSGCVGQQAPEREICPSSSPTTGVTSRQFYDVEKQTLVLRLPWKALYGHSYFPSLVKCTSELGEF